MHATFYCTFRLRAKLSQNLSLCFSLLLGSLFVTSLFVEKAYAQTSCPEVPTSTNSVTLGFSVTETNTYTVWTRIIVPDSNNNSLWLQIDNGCAINVGDNSSIPANQLTWVNFQNGNTASVISLPLSAGNHTVKITERDGGVGIDRLLLTTNISCTPTGTGNNCPDPTATPTITIDPTTIPTPINELTPTVTQEPTSTPIPTPTLTLTPTPTIVPSPTPTRAATPTPLPPTATPVVQANGLLGTYYNNMDFTGTSLMQIDNTINFNWRSGVPATGIAKDTFSVRWTGYVVPRYSQTYRFYARTDDGVRLWVNNTQIINRWRNQSVTEVSGTITLTAGTKYPIRMDYYENSGNAVAELRWSSSSQSKQIIPMSQLYRP